MRASVLRAILAALGVVAAACSGGTDGPDASSSPAASEELGDPGDCVVVPMAISPEKIDLVTELALRFNRTDTEVAGRCTFVSPKARASGEAMHALASGWDESHHGPRPVVWSPAASAWGAILDQRRAQQGGTPMAAQGVPLMNTPLVIAMPEPMATALGWPDTPIGWADVVRLSTSDEGWAAYGHPEWGPFRLGKTNPNFSTSGLTSLIAQNYAAAGTTRGLTIEDLAQPQVAETNRQVESAVVHYGDTTLTFLNNWYRADQQGTGLQYVSAVAVEEKSVIDYNLGNPDGVLSPGEEVRPPRVPLVAVYPKEGTIFSDNPLIILDAPWVTPELADAAEAFQDFVLEPENQRLALQYNFRPANPTVAIGSPVDRAHGVNVDEPQTLLQVPTPPVMVELLDNWAVQRKDARVLLVVDVSGSMKEPADPPSRATKLHLAQEAATAALDDFKPTDQVGLRVFSTGLGSTGDALWLDPVPLGPIASNGDALRRQLSALVPTNGTPLYDVARSSFDALYETYDPERINAVVLLTDGRNDDGGEDDLIQLADTVTSLQRGGGGGDHARPVRLFTIGYGADADLAVLRQLAEATNGAAYNASDPRSIEKVFISVVSNF